MNNTYTTGQWIKVLDKDNNILASGQIVFTKNSQNYNTYEKISKSNNINEAYFNKDDNSWHEFIGFSFDNKFFFNEKSIGTNIFVENNEEHLVKEFDYEHMPKYLTYSLYRQAEKEITEDIVRDFGIDELDEEVVSLVDVLNKFDDVSTTGSCCGHNMFPLYVDMIFYDCKTLFKMLWLIGKSKYNEKLCLMTVPDLKNQCASNGMMRLTTTMIGEEAYKVANDFAKDLEMICRN